MSKTINKILNMSSKKKTEKVDEEKATSEVEIAPDIQNEQSQTTDEHQDEKLILQSKIDELNDKNLRLYSEFDNYRKRTIKEKIELSKSASEEIIASLLTIMDDFERGLQTINETSNIVVTKEGIQLIYSKFANLLQQKGVAPITSLGEDFNTDFHEAITNIPAEADHLKGKVVDEIQKGYTMNGKVIRFSKVIVAQ